MIVYSERLARSASDKSKRNIVPFSETGQNGSYNIVYSYFLDICQKYKLTAAFTTSADIVGAGICQSYWTFNKNKWQKHSGLCYSTIIFDKFSPTRTGIKKRRQLLFSHPLVKPFNDPSLYNIFFDKQKTYNRLVKHAIPTISIDDSSLLGIKSACKTLSLLTKKHNTSADFSSDIVMKDRFGAGGRHVYKYKSGQNQQMFSRINKNSKVSYIIQPFANFDSTDIRLIYFMGEIVQTYIRVAKNGEFRCNEHRGGLLTYLPLANIPQIVVDKSNIIAKSLNKKHSLFSLDFIMSNNGHPYLLEGNTGPGLDWNMSLSQNEIEAKKLINLVVSELATRSRVLN